MRPKFSGVCASKVAMILDREILGGTAEEGPEQFARDAELLWFVQWSSWQPGSLERFARELIECHRHEIGTISMTAIPKGKSGLWTREECWRIWESDSHRERTTFPVFNDLRAWLRKVWAKQNKGSGTWDGGRYFWPDMKKVPRSEMDKALKRFNADYMRGCCAEIADVELEPLLLGTFNGLGPWPIETPFWWHNLDQSIRARMRGLHDQGSQLAATAVSRKLFDYLDFALEESKSLLVEGNARIGKTTSIEAKCALHPGRMRYLVAPRTGSRSDIVRAFATALGVSKERPRTEIALRHLVEDALGKGGLTFVIDEAHCLLPPDPKPNTVPDRLEWIRQKVIDAGNQVVLVETPERFFKRAQDFCVATGYDFEQFATRILRMPRLPDKPSLEDLKSVIAFHYPEASPQVVGAIASKAKVSQLFYPAADGLMKRAIHLAKRQGKTLSVDHVFQAAAELLPGHETTPADDKIPSSSRVRTPNPKGALRSGFRNVNGFPVPRGVTPYRVSAETPLASIEDD